MARVLAVDPGYGRLGVAVLEQAPEGVSLLYSDCIETDAASALHVRLHSIGVALEALLETYAPEFVAVETLFFNKNQKTAIGVAESRGVVLFVALSSGCHILELGPQEVKVAVTGYGKSDKTAVIEMVRRLVPGTPDRAHDDEYDAIAIGVTALAIHRGVPPAL